MKFNFVRIIKYNNRDNTRGNYLSFNIRDSLSSEISILKITMITTFYQWWNCALESESYLETEYFLTIYTFNQKYAIILEIIRNFAKCITVPQKFSASPYRGVIDEVVLWSINISSNILYHF